MAGKRISFSVAKIGRRAKAQGSKALSPFNFSLKKVKKALSLTFAFMIVLASAPIQLALAAPSYNVEITDVTLTPDSGFFGYTATISGTATGSGIPTSGSSRNDRFCVRISWGDFGFETAVDSFNPGSSFSKSWSDNGNHYELNGERNIRVQLLKAHPLGDFLGGPCVVGEEVAYDTVTVSRPTKANLTVTKSVVTDDGGTKVVSDFPLFVNGESVTSGDENEYDPGTYTVTETASDGYTATFGGDCNENGEVTLEAGDNKTCTITNDDQPGTLIVKKVVINDNGGGQSADDFQFSVNEAAPTSFLEGGENSVSVSAGTYSVTEPAVANYTTTYDNCSDLVIPNGGTATCTITNDDIAPTLTVNKIVVGGPCQASDFPLYVDGNPVTSGAANSLNAGMHTVTEDNVTNCEEPVDEPVDEPEDDGDECDGDDCEGEEVLEVSNRGLFASLINFFVPQALAVDDTPAENAAPFAIFSADPTTVNEGGSVSFDANGSTDTDGTIVSYGWDFGDESTGSGITTNHTYTTAGIYTVTLTVTDDGNLTDVETTLITVEEEEVACDSDESDEACEEGGEEGGEEDREGVDCELHPDTDGCPPIEDTPQEPEPFISEYVAVYTGACDQEGNVDLKFGDNVTCDLYNIHVPTCEADPNIEHCDLLYNVAGALVVSKQVVNNDGQDSVPGDFTLELASEGKITQSFSGSLEGRVFWLLPGTYNVSEPSVSVWYNQYFGESDCDEDGNVTIGAGNWKNCTVVNDDRPRGTLRVVKQIVNNSNVAHSSFTLTVTNVNNPEETYSVPGSVAGVALELFADEIYEVSEIPNGAGYSMSYSGDCVDEGEGERLPNGQIRILADTEQDCTITNTYSITNNIGGGTTPGTGGGGRYVPPGGDVLGVKVNEKDEVDCEETPEAEECQEEEEGGDETGDTNDTTDDGENASGGDDDGEGEVLGEKTEVQTEICELQLGSYIHPNSLNNPSDVIILQNFLNEHLGLSLTVSGNYGAASIQAVKDFQTMYRADILTPWGLTQPTGYVYITTRNKINEFLCAGKKFEPEALPF